MPVLPAVTYDKKTREAVHNMDYRRAVHDGLAESDPAAAYRYGHCREEGFGWYYHCPNNDGHYATYVPAYCMLRVCPDCGQYSAHLIQKKYRPVLEAAAARDHRKALKFLTLTTHIELTNDLGPAVKKLLDQAGEFYRLVWGEKKGGSKKRHEKGRGSEKDSGAIGNLEVGEHGLKLHVHMIIKGSYQPQAELSDLWRYVSGGDFIVHISEISADKAVKEGLKYITKFANLNPEQLISLHTVLKGRRRIRSWGCFYNPDIEEDVEERETHCPECQAQLRYTSELMFEQWRESTKEQRRRDEMMVLANAGKSLLSLLQFTDANKFFGPAPPNEQISFLAGDFDQLDDLINDGLKHRLTKRGLQ